MLTSNKSLRSHMLIILPKKKSGGLWITNTVNTRFFGEPRCSKKMSKTPQNGVKLENFQNLGLSNRENRLFGSLFFEYFGVAWPRSEANGLKEFIDFWQISRQDQSSGPWKSMRGRCKWWFFWEAKQKGDKRGKTQKLISSIGFIYLYMFYLVFLKPSGVAITSKNHHVHVALHAALLKSRNMFIETQKHSMVLNCALY